MKQTYVLVLLLFSNILFAKTKQISLTQSWIIKMKQECSVPNGCYDSFEYNGKANIQFGNKYEKTITPYLITFKVSSLNNNQLNVHAMVSNTQIDQSYQFLQKVEMNKPFNLLFQNDIIQIDGRFFISN